MDRILRNLMLTCLAVCGSVVTASSQQASPPTTSFSALQGQNLPSNTSPSLANLAYNSGSGQVSKLFIAYVANDSSHSLWIDSTLDGVNDAGLKNFPTITAEPLPGAPFTIVSDQTSSHFWLINKASNADSLWICEGTDSNPTQNTSSGVNFSCQNFGNVHMINSPQATIADVPGSGETIFVDWITSSSDPSGAGNIGYMSYVPSTGAIYTIPTIAPAKSATIPPSLAVYNGGLVAVTPSYNPGEGCQIEYMSYTFQPTSLLQSTGTYPVALPPSVVVETAPGSNETTLILGVQLATDSSNAAANDHLLYGVGASKGATATNSAQVGSPPAQAVWTPVVSSSAGNGTLNTTAFLADASGNALMFGSQAVQ